MMLMLGTALAIPFSLLAALAWSDTVLFLAVELVARQTGA